MKGTNKPRQNFQVRNEQKKKFKKKPSKEDNSTGLSVKVGDDFNKAMRLFKKKVLNDGRLNEIHERQFFTPSLLNFADILRAWDHRLPDCSRGPPSIALGALVGCLC